MRTQTFTKIRKGAFRPLSVMAISAIVLLGVSQPAAAQGSLFRGVAERSRDRFEQVTDKRLDKVAEAVTEAVAERRYALRQRVAFEEGANLFAYLEKAESESFVWPVAGTFTSEFGMRWGAPHMGVDISAPSGTPIWASRPGTVVSAYSDGGYGNKVTIDHGDGTQSVYAHNQSNFVSVGEYVAKGQTIASVGSTGDSSGPHVHFEIHAGGVQQNPRFYIPRG